MLKGDCNKCVHGDMPENSKVCVECGIARKNYEEKTMAEYIDLKQYSFRDKGYNNG